MSFRYSIDSKMTTKSNKLTNTTTKLPLNIPKFFLIYFAADNTTVILSKEDFINYKSEGLVGDTVKVKYGNEIFSGKILFAADDKKLVESYTTVSTFASRKRQRVSETPPKCVAPINPSTNDEISF
ncbi:unnamed protein product [Didymodactylos carnosus]|uniref:Uncharacterized protein n=1 Tax=Didymodactylos carnosus TaxID=1234261 RepID=A0A815CDP2_9BILA|nr:unnamed protein product [Didymodactylos carnosus]CAF1540102.1 unnamed protein product [Didymodactylos carnosus]CAF4079248.1 unnamed protein product [Didymodactylos carnosus]CAF4328380.1 unnamed protein product [Didymodactylos carnosus]